MILEIRTVSVIAINKGGNPKKATFTIMKTTPNHDIRSDDKFNIRINLNNNDVIIDKRLKVEESFSFNIYFEADAAPMSYEVSEIGIPDGWHLVGIDHPTGIIEPGTDVKVIITNDRDEKYGAVTLTKTSINGNPDIIANNVFTLATTITGTFEWQGERITNGSKTVETTLHAGETVRLGVVKWTGDAPTYKVEEKNIPDGWVLREIRNSEGTLREGDTGINAICSNEYFGGHFKIHKVIVDKDGNPLSNVDRNKEFTFEIYKDVKFLR